jgi:hypothetical protein
MWFRPSVGSTILVLGSPENAVAKSNLRRRNRRAFPDGRAPRWRRPIAAAQGPQPAALRRAHPVSGPGGGAPRRRRCRRWFLSHGRRFINFVSSLIVPSRPLGGNNSRASPGKIRLDPLANNSCQCLAGAILTPPPTKPRAKLSSEWCVTRSELRRRRRGRCTIRLLVNLACRMQHEFYFFTIASQFVITVIG